VSTHKPVFKKPSMTIGESQKFERLLIRLSAQSVLAMGNGGRSSGEEWQHLAGAWDGLITTAKTHESQDDASAEVP
jgi:hypothetical protein